MVAKDRPQIKLSYPTLKEGLRVGFRNPKALMDYVMSGLQTSVENQIYDLALKIGWDTWQLAGYWYMIRNNRKLKNHIGKELKGVNYGQMLVPELLYALVRKLCPSVVVETGVAAGVSSAYILQALHDNEHGKLYSIDYPNHALVEASPLPKGRSSGFVVPDYLRDRWELQIGKTKELLPIVLNVDSGIDMFIHDSEHSYDNMMFEYLIAWGVLKYGGLLVSHDINDNKAFKDFCNIKLCNGYEIYFTGMGVIRK